MIHLRYDGKYDWIPGDSRQWTVISSCIDANGAERKGSSFLLPGLKELGIVKEAA